MSRAQPLPCFHCGEPVPPSAASAVVDGQRRSFCCDGCAAAAAWIRDAGLGDYYRLRAADGTRAAVDGDYLAWDRDDVQHGHAIDTPRGREITVVVDGMRCAACAWLIDHALQREPGVQDVGSNAVTGRVRIAWDPARTTLSRPLARLAALGYRPHLARGEAVESERRRERNRLIARLGVAALATMQTMMFAEALYLDTAREMAPATRDFFRWIAFLVSTPVVFWSGWPFLAGMARELRARHPGMDTLVATSVLLAWGASLVETLREGAHVWYDAAVMFVFFLLAARFLEQMARRQAGARLDTLARAQPALAWREGHDGREQVPVSALRVGDVLRIGAGETVAADGDLLEAGATVDESLLTGESEPVAKKPGATLYAGSVCREAGVRLRVSRVGSDTRLSQLARTVERAQARRPRLARLADTVAMRFVLFLFVAAVVVFFAWWRVQPERAFEVALAVLVVSCPCALSLAVPAALASAHAALARIGVLVVGEDALQALAEVDTVVFDKTGTLTVGRPRLRTVEVVDGGDPQPWLDIAAALESGAGHPLAAAFDGAGVAPADGVRADPGRGVRGRVDGRDWFLGRSDYAAAGLADDGALWLGDGQRAVARFVVADALRGDAPDAIAALRAQGLHPALLSGDGDAAVRAVAGMVGIDDVAARCSPEDKLADLRRRQADGHRVLMVGDGINDAPVLAGADVAMAMAEGAPLAHRAAGLVLAGASLSRVPQAVAIARRARRVVRQNLAWALGYNLLALPVAAAGLVTPGLAALGMAASSLLVTGNALRLARDGQAAPRPDAWRVRPSPP